LSKTRYRARELNLIIGTLPPGPNNSITDVPDVKVGQTTLFFGEGPLKPGFGPVRTGVTVILPHAGDLYSQKVIAATATLNGYGKAAGLEQIREMGVIETPIALTNTLNIGLVWDALVDYSIKNHPEIGVDGPSVNPVVLDCNDGYLNDIRGRHVHKEHVQTALAAVKTGLIQEGAVGAGTGMSCFGFKGGIGTASRLIGDYVLGVLLVANFGQREQLSILGAPVGIELANWPQTEQEDSGSIVAVFATNAPMTCRQLERICRRYGMGLSRTGSIAGNTSGDFALAFSTAQTIPSETIEKVYQLQSINEDRMQFFFQAAIEVVQEAILNALLKAETTIGRDGHIRHGLPTQQLVEILHRYGHNEVNIP
jgi:D-aminopeptidase